MKYIPLSEGTMGKAPRARGITCFQGVLLHWLERRIDPQDSHYRKQVRATGQINASPLASLCEDQLL